MLTIHISTAMLPEIFIQICQFIAKLYKKTQKMVVFWNTLYLLAIFIRWTRRYGM